MVYPDSKGKTKHCPLGYRIPWGSQEHAAAVNI